MFIDSLLFEKCQQQASPCAWTSLFLTSRHSHRLKPYPEACAPQHSAGTGAWSTGGRWASPAPTVWWRCGRQPSATWSLCNDPCSPACPKSGISQPRSVHNVRCSVSTEHRPPSHPALLRQQNDNDGKVEEFPATRQHSKCFIRLTTCFF